MNVIAYLRVSTQEQDLDSQRNLIRKHAEYKGLQISEWIELEISSRKEQRFRRIHELKAKLQPGDALITSELSRLGRSMVEVVQLVSELIARGVRVVVIHQNLDNGQSSLLDPIQKLLLGIFSSLAEMERDLISQRTREGLAVAKLKGQIGGRRVGTLYHSKYDKYLPRIKNYLTTGYSLATIVKLLKEGTADSLSNYLLKRGLRDKSKKGPRVQQASAAMN